MAHADDIPGCEEQKTGRPLKDLSEAAQDMIANHANPALDAIREAAHEHALFMRFLRERGEAILPIAGDLSPLAAMLAKAIKEGR